MKNSPEKIYNKDDYVFFKMKGYPWWPGYITDIEKSNKKQIYTIADPFTNTLSKINDIKNIIKFEENIENIASKAKGKKYINSIIVSIETYFEGRKMPEKYNKIIKELKSGNNGNKNINNDNSNGSKNSKDKNDINDIHNKTKIEKNDKNENKNEYLLNKKRKPLKTELLNNKNENKIKKVENDKTILEKKESKASSNKDSDSNKKKKKPILEGLEKIKEEIREKERREQEKLKELKEKEKSKEKSTEKKEEKSDSKKSKQEKVESKSESLSKESIESSVSFSSEKKENNLMIKNCKNFDFYQIVKYLKRIAEYLDKNQKEGKDSYFTIEDKKNFINVMEYLNKKEMNDTIQFLKITNIGNYINYINKKTKIKEFKELTKKFLDSNSEKIHLQLLVEKAVNINDDDINF